MNMTALRFLLVIPLWIIINFAQVEVKSTAPYIYFYSEQQSAFLIERADGTNVSVLAQYKLPENDLIGGPSWSPSGKKFAWFSSSEYGPYPEQPSRAFLIDDQRVSHSLLDGLSEISLMHWSPKSDLLLVTRGVISENSTNGLILEMYIFDENAHIVFKKEYFNDDVLYIEWSPSGDYILIYLQTDTSEKDGIFKMEVVDLNQNVQQRDFYQASEFCSFPRWSVNNTTAYFDVDKENLVLENLANEGTKFQINLQSKIPLFIDWSPNGEYALIYMTSNCPEFFRQDAIGQVWLLSMSSKELKFIAGDVRLPQLPYLNRLTALDAHVYPYSAWSPNSKYGALLTLSQAILFTPKDAKTQTIFPATSRESERYTIKWASNDVVMFDWAERAYRIDHVYAYNVVTSELQSLVTPSSVLTPDVRYFTLSADQEYLAYAFSNQCDSVCIVNLATKDQVSITFQTDITSAGIVELIWHPNRNWLFLLGEIDLSSGLRQVNVVNATGASQSVLGICRLGTSCFGWMPDS